MEADVCLGEVVVVPLRMLDFDEANGYRGVCWGGVGGKSDAHVKRRWVGHFSILRFGWNRACSAWGGFSIIHERSSGRTGLKEVEESASAARHWKGLVHYILPRLSFVSSEGGGSLLGHTMLPFFEGFTISPHHLLRMVIVLLHNQADVRPNQTWGGGVSLH